MMRQDIQQLLEELREEQRQLDLQHQEDTKHPSQEEDLDYLEERYQMVDLVLWSSISELQKALAKRGMRAKIQNHLTHLRGHIERYEQQGRQKQSQRQVAEDIATKEREIVEKLEKLAGL